MQFLGELGVALTNAVGPFTGTLTHKAANRNIGSSVYACKPGKSAAIMSALKELDFTTIARPVSYVYGGTRVEASGEKTFVNYNSAVGVLIVGTDITKRDPL